MVVIRVFVELKICKVVFGIICFVFWLIIVFFRILGFGVRVSVVIFFFFGVRMMVFELFLKVWVIVEIIKVFGGKLLMVKLLFMLFVSDLIMILLELVIVKIVLLIGKFVVILRICFVIDVGLGVSKIFNLFVWLEIIIVLVVWVVKLGVVINKL